MSEQVTLQVSEQVLRHANYVAAKNQQAVEDVLSHWLETVVNDLPVQTLSDKELIALTESQMGNEEQAVLSDLLEKNREGELNDEEQHRLNELMGVYERGLLRKSQALREAVARGLLQLLQS